MYHPSGCKKYGPHVGLSSSMRWPKRPQIGQMKCGSFATSRSAQTPPQGLSSSHTSTIDPFASNTCLSVIVSGNLAEQRRAGLSAANCGPVIFIVYFLPPNPDGSGWVRKYIGNCAHHGSSTTVEQRSRTPRKRFQDAKPRTADENETQQGVPPLRRTRCAEGER